MYPDTNFQGIFDGIGSDTKILYHRYILGSCHWYGSCLPPKKGHSPKTAIQAVLRGSVLKGTKVPALPSERQRGLFYGEKISSLSIGFSFAGSKLCSLWNKLTLRIIFDNFPILTRNDAFWLDSVPRFSLIQCRRSAERKKEKSHDQTRNSEPPRNF